MINGRSAPADSAGNRASALGTDPGEGGEGSGRSLTKCRRRLPDGNFTRALTLIDAALLALVLEQRGDIGADGGGVFA